jgi:hypothetical protein
MSSIPLPEILSETSTKDGAVFTIRCAKGGDDKFFNAVLEAAMGLNGVIFRPKIVVSDNSKYAFVYTKRKSAILSRY